MFVAEEPTTQARITEPTSHARTTSVSSVSNLITDQTLRRLLKDLHRCEVSLVKYEGMLSDVGYLLYLYAHTVLRAVDSIPQCVVAMYVKVVMFRDLSFYQSYLLSV